MLAGLFSVLAVDAIVQVVDKALQEAWDHERENPHIDVKFSFCRVMNAIFRSSTPRVVD